MNSLLRGGLRLSLFLFFLFNVVAIAWFTFQKATYMPKFNPDNPLHRYFALTGLYQFWPMFHTGTMWADLEFEYYRNGELIYTDPYDIYFQQASTGPRRHLLYKKTKALCKEPSDIVAVYFVHGSVGGGSFKQTSGALRCEHLKSPLL